MDNIHALIEAEAEGITTYAARFGATPMSTEYAKLAIARIRDEAYERAAKVVDEYPVSHVDGEYVERARRITLNFAAGRDSRHER